MALRWGSRIAALIIAAVLVSGCAQGPADDPAAKAVGESHAAVATMALAVRLSLDGRATSQSTQVMIDDSVETVADAQQSLMTSSGTDPARLQLAESVIGPALTEGRRIADQGPDALGASDLQRLQELEQDLADAVEELGG